jgi:hypothetical protein
MAAKRSIMRIEMDAGAKERLDEICAKRGMTQISLMSRVVNWFSNQDDYVQTAVLQTLSDESMADLAKLLVKKLSSGK